MITKININVIKIGRENYCFSQYAIKADKKFDGSKSIKSI